MVDECDQWGYCPADDFPPSGANDPCYSNPFTYCSSGAVVSMYSEPSFDVATANGIGVFNPSFQGSGFGPFAYNDYESSQPLLCREYPSRCIHAGGGINPGFKGCPAHIEFGASGPHGMEEWIFDRESTGKWYGTFVGKYRGYGNTALGMIQNASLTVVCSGGFFWFSGRHQFM